MQSSKSVLVVVTANDVANNCQECAMRGWSGSQNVGESIDTEKLQALDAVSERAPAERARTDWGTALERKIEKYCRECGGMGGVSCIVYMAVYGHSFRCSDRNRFERDTGLEF